MKWVDKDLGDIVTFMSGGTPSKQKDEYWGGDIAWVSAKDLKGQRIYDSGLHITEAGAANGTRLVPENTILFVVRGMSLESEFRISLTKIPVTFNQDLKALCPSENIDPVFLFYSLYTRRDHIRQLASEASHGTKKLPTEVIKSIKLQIPDINTQKKVASIASAYDDLIENNRRRIQLLERSLHLLYKEWFVHLRFPSHEHSKIVDGIPEGWENKKITELSVVIDGTHDSPKPTDNGYYMVTGRHIINGFIDFSKCYFISEEDHRQVMQRSKPEKGDIIFSNIGTLGSTVLVDQDFEFSIKNLALFKPHKKIYSNYLYGFFSDPRRIEDLNNQSSGTSQKFFSLKFLRSLSILTPPLPILEYFDDLAQSILKQRSLLHYENIKLQQARDLLLPKLMSGAISV
ncbi:hypothetical protein B9G53_07020 [Pseudanabaena sp. SR411]|uniref:restriction endonuclease subunit S n=1 Tax=Pseudanabaena sp. SR411 TaxID=1980935 RepID=UPI000B995546|nr:restriction endonuclease subunit S [Pseudanabaena sp. SR411]OYQ65537.1 hypothetical protein B9G53_07020 [Pseudanabaena sp. SR411]